MITPQEKAKAVGHIKHRLPKHKEDQNNIEEAGDLIVEALQEAGITTITVNELNSILLDVFPG